MDDIFQAVLAVLSDVSLAQLAPLALVVTIALRIWTIQWIRDRVFGWVKRLPKDWQPVAPITLAMAIQLGQGYVDGLRGEALWVSTLTVGLGSAALAAGVYHCWTKRGWPIVARSSLIIWRLVAKHPSGATAVLLVGLSPWLWSCAVSLESSRAQGAAERRAGASPAAPSTRCETLDSQHRWGGATAVGAALLAGGSGLAGVEVDADQRQLRQGLAVAAAGMAALAAGAEWYARDAASTWAEECQR